MKYQQQNLLQFVQNIFFFNKKTQGRISLYDNCQRAGDDAITALAALNLHSSF